MTTDDPMIAALLREREGYANRGMNDRVALVDEQLLLRGHTPPAADPAAPADPLSPSDPPTEPGPSSPSEPRTAAPKGRRARPSDAT